MKKSAGILCCVLMLICKNQLAQFTDYTDISGINFYGEHFMWGTGISAVDFNGDGLDDLTMCSNMGIAMYQSAGDGTFTIVNLLYINAWLVHVLWVDYDNDDDLDLFATSYGQGLFLYEQESDFVFVDRSDLFSEFHHFYGTGACWADYDKDGWKDLFVCQYQYGIGTPNRPNLLFHNEGGVLVEVGSALGVASWANNALQSAWTDFDNDGWVDLYVVNDHDAGNEYYKNIEGLYFENQSYNGSGLVGSCMSNSIADFDRDGDFDVYISNSGPQFLLRNDIGSFQEVSEQWGAYLYTFGWGALWIDYNSDGWEDFYLCNDENWTSQNQNFFLENVQGSQFVQNNFDPNQEPAYSIVKGDFNGDLSPDMAIFNGFPGEVHIWMNQGAGDHHSVKIGLNGEVSDHFGVGAKVHLFYNGEYSLHQVLCGETYLSQNSNQLIVGTGVSSMIDSLRVEWPSGWIDVFYGLSTDTAYVFTEGETFEAGVFSATDFKICPQGSTEVSVQGEGLSSFLWSDGSISNTTIIVDTGAYWLTVTHPLGISDTVRFHISHFAPANYDVTATPPVCPLGQDGFFSVFSVELVQINGQPIVGEYMIDSLSAGDYVLGATDFNGCSTEVMFSIVDPIAMTIESDSMHFCPSSLVFPEVDVLGGSAPYDVHWPVSLTSPQEGNHVITVLDSNGCSSEFGVALFPYNQPSLSVLVDTVCLGGSSAWSFFNSDSSVAVVSTQLFPEVQGDLSEGMYTLFYTDENGCEADIDFAVVSYSPMTVTFLDTLMNEMEGVYAAVEGGVPPYAFLWQDQSENQWFTPQESGTYTGQVTDSEGCVQTFQTDISLGKETAHSPVLKPFPNPFNDYIAFNLSGVQNVSVFNALGACIYSENVSSSFLLETNNWSDGVYFVVTAEGTHKMVKQTKGD
jgi:hypothetical protein